MDLHATLNDIKRDSMRKLIILALLSTSVLSHAWEDHPDREDHRETDRLFKILQKVTKAGEFEDLRGHPEEEIIAFCEKNHINYEEVKDVLH
jgi:hypothetical protein